MNKVITAAFVAIVIAMVCQVASAETTVSAFAEPGARTHDGFFLRLSTGLGASPGVESAANETFETKAPSMLSDVAVGWAIDENLILHADFASVEVIGNNGNVRHEEDYESLHLDGFGLGATYYVMPLNAYISGSITTVNGTTSKGYDFDMDNSATGFGANAMVGKEWWVSDNWGLGVAGMVNYTRIKLERDPRHRDISTYGLLFSATYN